MSGVPQAAGYRDAFRGNTCHTWNAEGDIVESRVHLRPACRRDSPSTSPPGVGLLGGLIGLGGAEFRLPPLIGLFGFGG
jgi:hypothetical protein